MKILIEASTYNHKLYHYLCLEFLKSGNKKIQFGIVRCDKVAKKFLKNQNDIKYEFYDNDDYLANIHHYRREDKKKFLKIKNTLPNPDYKVLSEFEKTLDEKSIWKIVSSDRFLGRSFLSGVIGYDNELKNDRDFILKIISERIKFVKKIFLDFKPDIFLPMVAGGSISVFIYYYLCKKYDVTYLIHFDLRTKNYFSYTSNLNYIFPLIEDDAKLYLDSPSLNPHKSKAKELYEDIIKNLKNNDYFNIEKRKLKINGKLDKIIHIIKIILGSIKHIFRFMKIEYAFRQYILSKLQNLWLPSLGHSLKNKQKYIYYPLHSNPEYSTSVMGVMWQDQLVIIESLAKSIPHDWIVYVKEHPGVMTSRIRPYSMYKRILKIPNVIIAPVYEDTNKIIENSQMVAVVTGTAGWEAVLRNKPVIHFVDVFYQKLDLSKKCSDLNKLSNIIHDEYERIKNIDNNERRKRIEAFLSSFINNGFTAKYPHQLLLENGTDEEYKKAGKQLSIELIKYINRINPNLLL